MKKKVIIVNLIILFLVTVVFAGGGGWTIREIYDVASDDFINKMPDNNAKYLFQFFKALGCKEGIHRYVDYVIFYGETKSKNILLVTTVAQSQEIIYEMRNNRQALDMRTYTNDQIYPSIKEKVIGNITIGGYQAEIRTIVEGITMNKKAEKIKNKFK